MNKGSYVDIMQEAEKKSKDRKAILCKKDGSKIVPRKYHLTLGELFLLEREWRLTKRFPNPFKKKGIFHMIIEALIDLGIDKKHSFPDLKAKIKELMTQEGKWEKFINKPCRNSYSSKDVNGRIIQNIMLLQRLGGYNPFGISVMQLGSCLDIFQRKDGVPAFRLRTGIDNIEKKPPINEYQFIKKGRRKSITPAD
jgi:hypothetical protein